MANRQRIGLRQIRALQPGRTIWDGSLPGFGARRQQSQAVSYVLFYWTPETAREAARRLLGEVAHKADPAAEKHAKRTAKTVAELCDVYFADAKAGRLSTRRVQKKSSTLAVDIGRIERHIKPLLGRRAVTAVTREDIEAFMHDVASGKTAGKTKTVKKRGLAQVRGGKWRSQSRRRAAGRDLYLCGAVADAIRQPCTRRYAACRRQARPAA
jgi:hypothetical protein